jgi:hypothetical protein
VVVVVASALPVRRWARRFAARWLARCFAPRRLVLARSGRFLFWVVWAPWWWRGSARSWLRVRRFRAACSRWAAWWPLALVLAWLAFLVWLFSVAR